MIIDRFWAELFRLSSDRTQWNILYPSLLSITVVEMPSRKHDVNCKVIRLLVKNESGIVNEQILDGCKYKSLIFTIQIIMIFINFALKRYYQRFCPPISDCQ